MARFLACIIVTLVLLTAFALAAPAPGSNPNQSDLHRVSRDPHWQTADVVQGRFKVSGPSMAEAAQAFIKSRQDLFKLENPDKELRLKHQATDNLGKTHIRFAQVFDGLRVWAREQIVHFDDPTTIYLIAGQTIPTPQVSTDPKLPADRAISLAKAEAAGFVGSNEVQTESELLIFPAKDDQAHLAWLVTLTGVHNGSIRYRVFVDAQNGQILNEFNDIEDDGPAVGSGIDVGLVNRTLQTYQFGANYRLVDATRPMYQPPVNNLTGVIATYSNLLNGGTLVQDPNGDNNFNDNPSLRPAVSGHYNASLTYEYYRTTFGRNSLDDNGLHIIVNVHDSAYVNNAYWNGSIVNFADGDGTNFLPFSGGLDVVAHELTHGVTQFTAGLTYQDQSGALNESMSDFFGAMVDRDDWLMGDEIRLTSPGYIRNMQDPHQGPDPTRYSFGYQPAYLNEYVTTTADNGGVHINSGIPNHAGYLVATAITREKAEKVWYRTLTVYLTPSSDFNFWAAMILQSTIDLYGEPSTELTSVSNSLATIGFGLLFADPPVVDPLSLALGTTRDTQIVVTNRRSETITWTSVTSKKGKLSLSTSGPSSLAPGDNLTITASASAIGLTNCDIGTIHDTVVLTTTSLAVPSVNIPVAITIGNIAVTNQTRTVATACMTASLNNVPSLNDMVRSSNDVLSKASLIITYKNGSDTGMYIDLYAAPTFATVDSLISGTISSDQTRTLRLASTEGKIQGKVRYQYEPADVPGCGYIAADYWLTNVCGAQVTILSGLLADFDVNSSGSNQAAFDAGNKMIYVRDAGNTTAGGMALLAGTPRNLRAINNPSLIWNGLKAGSAYKEMIATSNVNGSTADDWSALLTFGQNTLNAGDTAHYRAAFLYSTSGSSGLATILSQVNAPGCCTGTTGNVDMAGIIDVSDLSLLVAYLTTSPAPVLPCPQEANINGVSIIDVSDLSLLVAYLTQSPAPTLPNCP